MIKVGYFIVNLLVNIIILSLLFCFWPKKEQKWEEMKSYKTFNGDHKLRKILSQNDSKTDSSFFLLNSSSNGLKVYFSWLSNDGQYINSSFPLEKIRIKIDNKVDKPFIDFCTFVWYSEGIFYKYQDYDTNNKDTDEYLSKTDFYNSYVLIVCSEKDYPKNIKIQPYDK